MIPEIHGPDHKSMFNGVHGPGACAARTLSLPGHAARLPGLLPLLRFPSVEASTSPWTEGVRVPYTEGIRVT